MYKGCHSSSRTSKSALSFPLFLLRPALPPNSHLFLITYRLVGFVGWQGTGIDLRAASAKLTKPLRPLWFTPESRFFSGSPPDFSDCDFFPVICISASIPVGSHEMQRRKGYSYVQGSGDDHETWSLGLTPRLFWQNKDEILGAGKSGCDKAVQQVVARSKKLGGTTAMGSLDVPVAGAEDISFTKLGSSNIYLGNLFASQLLIADLLDFSNLFFSDFFLFVFQPFLQGAGARLTPF